MDIVLLTIAVVGSFALLVIDFMMPSGGVLTLGALAAAAYALVLAHQIFGSPGVIGLVTFDCLGSFIVVRWGINRLKLTTTLGDAGGSTDYSKLIGGSGTTLTALRPSGYVAIGDQRVDAVAESVMIEKDAAVKVVRVEGNRVVVRPVSMK